MVPADTRTAARNLAKGLRQVAVKLNLASKLLPEFRAAVSDSIKTVDGAKGMLDNALKQRDAIEPVLKDLPKQFVFLSEEFPKLTLKFTDLIRETSKITQTAKVLRETSMRTRAACEGLPQIQASISRGTKLLASSQQQLKHVIVNRDKYDMALQQTVVTLESLSVTIPATKSQIDQRLHEQKVILAGFEGTAQETQEMVSAYLASLRYTVKLLKFLLFSAIAITAGSFLFRNWGTSALGVDRE